MCEIFTFDPYELPIDEQISTAMDMYSSNPDGLGIVAVHRENGQFQYRRYKALEPSGNDVFTFLRNHQNAWRFVIHARLATHGAEKLENAHPISTVGCDPCEWKAVVHNGYIFGQYRFAAKNVAKGTDHDVSTKVDSELIAHSHESVPESVEELPDRPPMPCEGSYNYILFADNCILIHNEKYELDERMNMALSSRDHVESDEDIGWMLVYPDESVESREKPDSEYELWGGMGDRVTYASNTGSCNVNTGAKVTDYPRCDKCGKKYQVEIANDSKEHNFILFECNDCGHWWYQSRDDWLDLLQMLGIEEENTTCPSCNCEEVEEFAENGFICQQCDKLWYSDGKSHDRTAENQVCTTCGCDDVKISNNPNYDYTCGHCLAVWNGESDGNGQSSSSDGKMVDSFKEMWHDFTKAAAKWGDR